ncbi:MAG: cytochrome c [Hyphomicrobiales bacterium]|nr:cytochrome c [Hyphomicrobiales bacterium]
MSKATKIIFAAALVAFGAGAAVAESAAPTGVAAIKARQEILKGFGKAAKPVGAMAKGEAPFDLAVVQNALKTFAEGSKKLPGLFPDDSKEGGDTEALPRIWDEKAKFNAGYDKLAADSTAALAAIKDEASFKANAGKVFGDCKACHDDYRAKKK